MKVRLLNDGGFFGLSAIDFPVEVEAEDCNENRVFVPREELKRVPGYEWITSECLNEGYYLFWSGEFEIVTDVPVQEEVLWTPRVSKSQEIDLDALYAEMVEASNERQERLLSLIRDYGNPQTGVDRAERLYKTIEKIVKEQLI
jgi:hypothetical protein